MRIYSHKQLLLCDGKKEIYCHRGKLYVKNAYEKRETVINVIPRSYIYRLFSKISLLERMFRLSTRCAAWIDEDTFIFAQRRHIFKVSISKKNIEIEHSFQVGMNAPIKFCNIAGLPGFSDGILYGTYTGARGHVSIWQRDIWGCWSEKYRFPENRVLHIHNIVPDYKNKRLLILTGDLDTESGIWEAKNNFSEVNLLLGGKQQYRACVAFVEDNHILFATDTPLEDNFLYDFANFDALCKAN